MSLKGTAKAPVLLNILLSHTTTDLTAANLLWLAESMVVVDLSKAETVTLPGNAQYLGGVVVLYFRPRLGGADGEHLL